MGRLSLFIILVSLVAVNSFAATEKENQERESLRIETLKKELEKEEKSLHILKEEYTFCAASGEGTTERMNEIKESILAAEDNIKFLTAEIQSAKGEKPQAIKKPAEAAAPAKPKNRAWWDVYSREKNIQ